GVSLYRVSLPILGLGIGIAGWLTIVFTEWPPAGPYWVPALLSVDRKSTRLNSSHVSISYAVFCLKKKNHNDDDQRRHHPAGGDFADAAAGRPAAGHFSTDRQCPCELHERLSAGDGGASLASSLSS